MNGNPKKGFSLPPTTRPYCLLPLTYGPSLLYWLGKSGWCLSLVRTPLPFVSMACLLFMHSPWPGGLSGFCYTFCYSFLTSCGVDESLDFHSLYLASSLAWVLLRHEPFPSSIQPLPFLYCLQYYSWAWACTHAILGFLGPFHCFGASLAHFMGFIGFPTNLICLVSFFGFIRSIFAYFPYLLRLMDLLLLSSGSFGLACFLWGPFVILQAYGPLFLPFGVNGVFLNLLILLLYSLPYC